MPRFYFHLYNDMDVPDHEGEEHPDLNSARESARSQARLMVGETAKENGRIVLGHRIDIEDELSSVLATIWFGDVVAVEG